MAILVSSPNTRGTIKIDDGNLYDSGLEIEVVKVPGSEANIRILNHHGDYLDNGPRPIRCDPGVQ